MRHFVIGLISFLFISSAWSQQVQQAPKDSVPTISGINFTDDRGECLPYGDFKFLADDRCWYGSQHADLIQVMKCKLNERPDVDYCVFILRNPDDPKIREDKDQRQRFDRYESVGFGPYDSRYTNYFFGGDGDDHIYTGKGNDVLVGGNGVDLLIGYGGKDSLYGEDDDDFLYGGLGNDKLFGGNGNDWLFDGGGDDEITGGEGHDRFFKDLKNEEVDGDVFKDKSSEDFNGKGWW